MRRLLALGLVLTLGACVMPAEDRPDTASRAATVDAPPLPPVKTFALRRPAPPDRANADIARDFLDLAFTLESGRPLDRLTRFEGPISVRVTGRPHAGFGADLARLLARLRDEAGIDIALTRSGDANITIEAVSRGDIKRQMPEAACFVIPNVSSLSEYRRARGARLSWANLARRDRLAIFVPGDAAPQEVRGCLHEELAQALGPLNDLYRLPDSVFNDDDVHGVLTGFDMLILRAYYAPELQNGMSRAQVAARLPALLDRINPAGTGRAPHPAPPTPRLWIEAIQEALGPGTGPAARRAAAERAIAIAEAAGIADHRLGYAHYALGRLVQPTDPDRAQAEFAAAQRIYGTDPRMRLHRAFVVAQLAAYDIRRGDGAAALAEMEPYFEVAEDHENAALLSTLLMLRAEALDLEDRPRESRAALLDSLGWARYGFGPDWAVRARVRNIEALNPLKG
ncbi:DUF2927 domain-containing protein [Aquicoccus sp. SCR17]|nr:DUF2927 domain-containing protein [Carideicomes alvinocaridis]